MEFRILGSLEVEDVERRVALGARARALLAFFLLHPNEVVAGDRLVDALWGERPPRTARAALQVHVSTLRKVLGRERIETRASGYLFRLQTHELDASRFETLLREGHLREALALWRGPALADHRDEDWAQRHAARLDELRLAALEERVDADLGSGRHAEVVAELEALVRAEPLRERPRAQLMLALYRCGRQADALGLYQATRRLLVDELGIEPGEELRELHRSVLRHDPALAWARADDAPFPGAGEGRLVVVLACALGEEIDVGGRAPREALRTQISEYRYLAESLAGQYGCLHSEWVGEGHTFVFESADAAAQFGLKLIESWRTASGRTPALTAFAPLPLRVGCQVGEWIPLDGGGWLVRGSVVARQVQDAAAHDSLYVTEHLLDLLDLPLYDVDPAGPAALRGDHLPERRLYRVSAFRQSELEARPRGELTAEEWFLKGIALIGTAGENGEEEAEAYRQALALRPDYPEAHVNYAVLLRLAGRGQQAAHHYQEALRLRPDYPEAHYNYAAMLAGRGSAAGAAEHYREALRLRPEYVDAHHGYASLLALEGDLEGADEHFREALRLRPDDAEAHNNYAVLLERRGDVAAATEHYHRALGLRPSYPQAHYNLALLLESRGDLSRSEEHYREAVRSWPDYGEAHNNLAILLQLKGDLRAAEEHYRHALRTRPDDPETHYNYALLLRARGDGDAATRHLRIAYGLAPDEPVFRSALDSG